MKKYQVKINNMELEIIQDDDGKFITPYLCIEDWGKFGSALKPAFEPIIVARKPVEDSIINNVIKYGVGGINIDGCRVGNEHFEITDSEYDNNENQSCYGNVKRTPKEYEGRFPSNVILTYDDTDFNEVCGGMPNTKSNGGNSSMPDLDYVGKEQVKNGNGHKLSFGQVENAPRIDREDSVGRFPSNVILTYDDTDFEEVCGGMPNTKSSGSEANYEFGNQDNPSHLYTNIKSGTHFDDEGSAARYFYCAKASKKDRDSGLDMLEGKRKCGYGYDLGLGNAGEGMFKDRTTIKKNIHPTVKPVELMQYLIRLVSPKGATILDPFNGSGSTGKAVAFENRERKSEFKYIGIELDPEYCEISKGRIDYALNKFEYDMIQDIKKEEQETGQMSLFDIDYGEENEN